MPVRLDCTLGSASGTCIKAGVPSGWPGCCLVPLSEPMRRSHGRIWLLDSLTCSGANKSIHSRPCSLGLTLAYGGKGHEAVQHFEKETRLSPRDPFFFFSTGARSFAHFMAGEYELGLEWGRRAVRRSPEVSGGSLLPSRPKK